MGNRIDLEQKEKELYDKIVKLAKETRDSIDKDDIWGKSQEERYKEMSLAAHDLHMLLKDRGLEPIHHNYMLKNRGVPVDDVEFYNHIHSVEDLLAFIADTDANNDPEDTTIGEQFKFNIYTRRWGHYDHYTIERIGTGWNFIGMATFNSGNCEKDGSPYLYKTLDHDSVVYPNNLGELFEWLWMKAQNGLCKEEVQKALDDLAEWISTCERSVPRGIFEGLL